MQGHLSDAGMDLESHAERCTLKHNRENGVVGPKACSYIQNPGFIVFSLQRRTVLKADSDEGTSLDGIHWYCGAGWELGCRGQISTRHRRVPKQSWAD